MKNCDSSSSSCVKGGGSNGRQIRGELVSLKPTKMRVRESHADSCMHTCSDPSVQELKLNFVSVLHNRNFDENGVVNHVDAEKPEAIFGYITNLTCFICTFRGPASPL